MLNLYSFILVGKCAVMNAAVSVLLQYVSVLRPSVFIDFQPRSVHCVFSRKAKILT